MKIWKVRLALSSDGRGNWLCFFDVETNEKEYELINDNYCEIKKSWVRDEIPSKIKIEHIASGYLIECGFEYLPTGEDLKTIKKDMKRDLNSYIEEEFNRYEMNFKSKVKGLFSESE